MKLDSDEVIVEIPVGADCKNSISGNHPNIEDALLHHDPDTGLRSRKKVPAFAAIGEKPETNLITTTSQSQEQVEDDTGQPMTNSNIIEPAILHNSEVENIDEVSVTPSPVKTSEAPKTDSPRTPLMASQENVNDDDDDDEIFHFPRPKRPKKITVLFIIEFSLFVCITLVLILSANINKLKDKEIWSLELWKWCGLGLAIFCGHLFSEWLMNIVIFLIEKNRLLRKIVGYYVLSAHKSFRVFIWLGLILLTWVLLINRGASRSSDTTKVLNYITRGIASTLVVAGAWILRTIVLKFLYASFYEKRFFERIQENMFYQYILQTLSGPRSMKPLSQMDTQMNSYCLGSCSKSDFIDMRKLQRIKRGRVSAWTMSRLIEIASQSGFYTFQGERAEFEDLMNPDEQNNRNITNEMEAIAAAFHIFRNVAHPMNSYIEDLDLMHFMKREEVELVFPLIDEADERRVDRMSFTKWVVSMYVRSKYLEHSLNDIKKAIEELNKFVTGVLVVALTILWVILMGIVSTEVLLFISSQFFLAVFTFGSSAKSTFEAIIFVFVKHPFDVGDRCVIDGFQVVVEEVGILTTVFLRYDNEKIYYPNSVLATKSISNFNRSPDMRDTVEFDLDVFTSAENISALKAKIHKYIERKPEFWHPNHHVQVREIEDVNKMKMRLYVTHTMNFQDYEKKSDRRSNLVLELRNIFQELEIKYHILPPTSSD